jgi:hypothetical protein
MGDLRLGLQTRIQGLEQELEDAHTELLVSIKERLVLGGQNAELEQQLTARFAENKELYGHWQNALEQNAKLEQQLSESRICETCRDKAVLAADKHREQNAKLVDVLKNIESDNMPFIDSFGRFALPREIAAEALKEMEV